MSRLRKCASHPKAYNERSEVFNQGINCIDLVQIVARYHDKGAIRFFSTSLLTTVSDNTRMYYFEKVRRIYQYLYS